MSTAESSSKPEEGSPAQPSLPLISVVVPAYNEALTLMGSLTTLYEYLNGLRDRYRSELIVVNDGSVDETADIAEAFARSREGVRVIHHPINSRLGEALRSGFAESRGDAVVTFDSDLSYSPDHIEQMVDALFTHNARVVIASPYAKDGRTTSVPFRREMMSRGANRILAINSQYPISTVTGMVRAYDGPFIRAMNLKAMGPEINAEILYKAQILRASVIEIPAHLDWSQQQERLNKRSINLRVSNTSKLVLFSSFIFRPFVFFVVPGLLLLLVAMWTVSSIALTVLRDFRNESGGVDHRLTEAFAYAWQVRPQSFIVGGFALVIAIQLLSFGMLAALSKRYFEELFHFNTHILRRLSGAPNDGSPWRRAAERLDES